MDIQVFQSAELLRTIFLNVFMLAIILEDKVKTFDDEDEDENSWWTLSGDRWMNIPSESSIVVTPDETPFLKWNLMDPR